MDTDIIINLLRGNSTARDFIANNLEEHEMLCSVISVAEIWTGMRPHEEEATRRLMDSLKIIEVSRAVAEKAGTFKGTTKSHSLELDDCLIAATAYCMGATLATGNGRHYPMKDIRKVVVAM
ncbi:MAG: type II toxin-antitoxin system VapC family toxin [Deltaproteobacteria bacterium]|nr:type II toxin-antitoxin system VapC family toxin [Deltaproteobacteria bacterium]